MQKIYKSWLGIAALMLVLFSNLTFAIDNPDAPDLIAEFETREKSLIATIEKPTNSTSDYLASYSNYLKFLDKELNTAYKTLRAKLPEDKQKKLKASQLSWIKYRDLEFAFIDTTWTNKDFGTSSGISRGQYKANIIRNRVIQLMYYTKTF